MAPAHPICNSAEVVGQALSIAECAVEGDFHMGRPCHFLPALTGQEESLCVRSHKQTLVTCLYDAAPGNTLKTHSRQAQSCWNSSR